MIWLLVTLIILISPPTPIFSVSSISPPQGVPPILYTMYGSADEDYGNNAGAAGAWSAPGWDAIEQTDDQYNWGPIENYLNSFQGKTTRLKNGQVIKKPVGIGINLLVESCKDGETSPLGCWGLIIPKWLIEKSGTYASQPSPQPNCGTAFFPKWDNPVFQEEFAELISKFGEKYDKDPRVTWVAINTGPYGEAISTMYNGRKKPDGSSCPAFETSRGFSNWVQGTNHNGPIPQQGVVRIFRQAFPTKPLFVINTGFNDRQELARDALEVSPRVGIKMHSWQPDLPQQNTSRSQVEVFKWYQNTCQQNGFTDCMTGLEHFYANNRPQSYWASLFLISHHMTIADITADHINAIKRLEDCNSYQENGQSINDCYPMWQLIENHLGRDVYTVPSVFTVLRDTNHIDITYANTNYDTQGEYGNWSQYLNLITRDYRSTEYPPVSCNELKPPYNRVNTDKDRMYGCWDGQNRRVARKTTTEKPSMDFMVDSRWPGKQSTGFSIEITYIDMGRDKFRLIYRDTNNQTQSEIIQKQDTGRFVRQTFDLPKMSLQNPLSGTTNFRIEDASDGPEYVHLVHLIPQSWQAPLWDFGPLAAGGTIYPTATRSPTSTPDPRQPTATVAPISSPVATHTPGPPDSSQNCTGCFGLIETCQRNCTTGSCLKVNNASCNYDAYRCCHPIATTINSQCSCSSTNKNKVDTADANCDGSANIVDYGLWANEFKDFSEAKFTSRNPWLADFNCDHQINIADYGILVNRWRQ